MSGRRAVFDWTRRVMRDVELSAAAKAVAWAIAEHCASNAVAWPKVEALGACVGIDARNVTKHVGALREAAYLIVEDRRHMREASWYWLAIDGETVGDFNAPPKPRATRRNRQEGTPDETVTPCDPTESSPAQAARPDETISHDLTEPSVTTRRNHQVTPSYSPYGTAQGTAKSARGPVEVVENEPKKDVRGALVSGYSRRYTAATRDLWQSAGEWPSQIDTVTRWCARQPDPIAAAEAVLDGVFADEYLTGKRWPWGPVAKDPAKYASAERGSTNDRAKAARADKLNALKREADKARERGDHARAADLNDEWIRAASREDPDAVSARDRGRDGAPDARQGPSGSVPRNMLRAIG